MLYVIARFVFGMGAGVTLPMSSLCLSFWADVSVLKGAYDVVQVASIIVGCSFAFFSSQLVLDVDAVQANFPVVFAAVSMSFLVVSITYTVIQLCMTWQWVDPAADASFEESGATDGSGFGYLYEDREDSLLASESGDGTGTGEGPLALANSFPSSFWLLLGACALLLPVFYLLVSLYPVDEQLDIYKMDLTGILMCSRLVCPFARRVGGKLGNRIQVVLGCSVLIFISSILVFNLPTRGDVAFVVVGLLYAIVEPLCHDMIGILVSEAAFPLANQLLTLSCSTVMAISMLVIGCTGCADQSGAAGSVIQWILIFALMGAVVLFSLCWWKDGHDDNVLTLNDRDLLRQETDTKPILRGVSMGATKNQRYDGANHRH